MQAFVSARPGPRWPWLLIAALVVLGLARFFLFTAQSPTLGYPNNFDFLRTSGCVGIWNFDAKSENFHSPAPDRVVPDLTYNNERLNQFCNPTTENFYLSALKLWHSVGDVFPIQQLAYTKLAIVLVFFAALMLAISSMRLRLFLSACLVLLLWDLSTLLYFQSLYPVFSSLFFTLFLAIALLACRTNAFSAKAGASALLLLALVFMLGFSNQQYFFLAVVLVALFVLFNGRRYRLHSAALLAGIVLASLTQLALRPVESKDFFAAIDRVNRTDMIFYGVMMYSDDPKEVARIVGLPEECAQFSGVSAHMFNAQRVNTCPEVAQVSRVKLLHLALAQPATIGKTMLAALDDYQSVYAFIKYTFFQHPSELAPDFYASSPSTLIEAAPLALYRATVAVMALLAAAAFAYSLTARGRQSLGANAIWLGGFICFYSIFSSVFGDGMVEVERHAAVFLTGFIMLWTGVVFALLQRRSSPREATA